MQPLRVKINGSKTAAIYFLELFPTPIYLPCEQHYPPLKILHPIPMDYPL